ncbi:MAG: TrbL protein [Parcubacteria group bacterium Gr01-1014_8]|nr:MAG: TrbL protein [Parcubacteria group bacterium Gr01-1014_8]
MREAGKRIPSILFSTGALAISLILILPLFAHAQFGSGNVKYCTGIACPCDMGPGPNCACCKKTPRPAGGVIGCYCEESANGKKSTGTCVAPVNCSASASEGLGGDMKGLMDALKLLQELFKKKEGGGGGGAPPPPPGAQEPPPCVVNPATKTKSPIPCKEANGMINYGDGTDLSGFGSSGTGLGGDGSLADTLLKALGGTVSSSGDDSDGSSEETSDDTGGAGTGGGSAAGGGGAKAGGSAAFDPKKLEGDIRVGVSGGTIFARSRDPGSNTEVAGFFGGNAFNANASRSLVGRLCAARPWAGGIIGSIIPPSFFDGLCRRGGYQVGIVALQPGSAKGGKKGTITITGQKQQRQTVDSSTIEAEVDIWAEPASVRLGTRTYIFWTSKGVESCKESGPSFSQNSPSGGASTVPLSGKSIFTIVCLTIASTTVEDSVTVNLAL